MVDQDLHSSTFVFNGISHYVMGIVEVFKDITLYRQHGKARG